jgi:hypothetical protein
MKIVIAPSLRSVWIEEIREVLAKTTPPLSEFTPPPETRESPASGPRKAAPNSD